VPLSAAVKAGCVTGYTVDVSYIASILVVLELSSLELSSVPFSSSLEGSVLSKVHRDWEVVI